MSTNASFSPPPSSSAMAWEEFRRVVVADPQLLGQLTGLRDMETFAARAVELAAARGLAFAIADVRAAVQAARSDWVQGGRR